MAEWHTSGGWAIPTVGQRTSFYGVSGVPHVRIDGKYSSIGAGSCSGAASSYRGLINTRLNETGGVSAIEIEGAYLLGSGTVDASVTFTKESAVTLTSPRAYIVVIENNLLYGGTNYNHIVRAEYHIDVTTLVNVGDNVLVEHSFPSTAWNLENIEVIAFLQTMTGNKEMYNGARIEMAADFEFAWDASIQSILQGNGTAEFEGTLKNISEETDTITLTLNNTFGWPAEFMVAGEAGFHTTPSQIVLSAQDEVLVTLRVNTDGQVRIGQGTMQLHSDLTDRTQNTAARVFNGSPAILFVDDDTGIHATEQTFITGLNAGNYLYDTWDVKNVHASTAPKFDDMKGYDIVLWATGWESYQPVTAADATELMAFLDLGKGFILSTQDGIPGFTTGATFLTDYLGIASYVSNVRALQANGVASDPISNGMALTLTYPTSSINRADQINANAIGTVIFHNEATQPIGIRADNGTSRTVTLSFAGTAIDNNPNPNNCATFLDRSIDWILAGMSQGVEERPSALASHIGLITPNPLSFHQGRGEATIRLRLSDAAAQAPVQLDIVDLTGRLVTNVMNTTLPSGVTAASWNGQDRAGRPVGAGVYYARLTTREGSSSARVVVLR